VEEAREFMREKDLYFAYVVDADRCLEGYVNRRDLREKTGWVEEYLEPAAVTIQTGTNLRDALSEMLVADYVNVCVVDERQRVRGMVNTEMIQKAVVESERAVAAESEGEGED
jgi:Mg/Co/Ni transporter MgtE